MLRISLETEVADDEVFLDNRLIVNGVLLLSSDVSRWMSKTGRLQAFVRDPDETPLLSSYPAHTLTEYFENLTLQLPTFLPEFTLTAELDSLYNLEESRLTLQFTIEINEWAGPWALGEYHEAIKQSLAQSNLQGTRLVGVSPDDINQFKFRCNLTGSKTVALQEELDHWTSVLPDVIHSAQAHLVANLDRNTLVTLFNFHKDVSSACEQYLLYFVQFLRDLGIEAGASIKHQAHQVLFSVTPEEGAEALDRIREALEIYLRLPDSPEFVTQAPGYVDIAVQQLQANIFHLNGQLAIANAVLQARNAQIEALQLSNFTYQQLLASQQQVATIPLLPIGTSGADVESLVPGVIEVTKYEGKGFTVNLPELLRRLKRRFD
jgi:hypothetical protein